MFDAGNELFLASLILSLSLTYSVFTRRTCRDEVAVELQRRSSCWHTAWPAAVPSPSRRGRDRCPGQRRSPGPARQALVRSARTRSPPPGWRLHTGRADAAGTVPGQCSAQPTCTRFIAIENVGRSQAEMASKGHDSKVLVAHECWKMDMSRRHFKTD